MSEYSIGGIGMSLLKQKIEQVKQELGYKYLSYLSIDLGHSHNYLCRVLREGLESKTEEKLIYKLDSFLNLHKKELTHDFEGKSLHKHIDDAMMVPKSEYEGLHKDNASLKEQNTNLFNENSIKDFQINQLKKEIDHKTQIAEKHADMRNKAELRVSELEKECGEKDVRIKKLLLNSGNQANKINTLENQVKSLQKDFLNSDTEVGNLKEKLHLSEQDSEKWQCDYWTVSRENVELINSKRAISIWLEVSILIIVLMAVYEVLHFNGVV